MSSRKMPKIPKVQILQSVLVKPPTTSTTKVQGTTTTKKPNPEPREKKNRHYPVISPPSPPPPAQGLPVLDDNLSVITIHSDSSTMATGNLGDNFELDMLLAQLEGDPAADYLFEPARIVSTPVLSEERPPTPLSLNQLLLPPPPPAQLPPLPPAQLPPPPPPAQLPPPPAAEAIPAPLPTPHSHDKAGKKRPRSHDYHSSSSKRGKNLSAMRELMESDLEEGYRPEFPSIRTTREGGLQVKAPRELALTAHDSLKKMEPVYRTKLLEARMKTAELERQLEAAKKEEKKIEKEIQYIGEFTKFVKCKKK